MTTTLNADDGVVSGSAGLKYSADSSGVLALQTNGTTAITVNASQNTTLAGTLTTSSRGITKASMPAGSVLQVVQATAATSVVNNTISYVSTGLAASITPSSASSKVLVIVQLPIVYGSQNFIIGATRIRRGSTTVLDNNFGNSVSAIVQQYEIINLSYLDSPATTSSTTYTIEFARNSTASPYGNFMVMEQSSGVTTGVILLQEVAG